MVVGQLKNLHFTADLSIRHARSDEEVAQRREQFAFCHNFERPTSTKWRESCQIHRCDPCAQDRKRIDFKPFSKDFHLQSFLQLSFSSLFSSL